MYRTLIKKFFSTNKSGKLYIWNDSDKTFSYTHPDVTKAAIGPNHYAFITSDNKLYRSYVQAGKKYFQALGHNTKDVPNTPKLVDFFTKNNLKVVDVSVGAKHTVVLTQNGSVWSFGVGNKKQSLLFSLFRSTMGALGHEDKGSHSLPKEITTLKNLPKVIQLSSGRMFNSVVNADRDIYNWGLGQLSVFGNGSNSNEQTPKLNQHFKYLRESENLTVQKLLSNQNCSMALLSDGYLYGWGSNDTGLMAINETGGEMYQTYFYPTKIFTEELGDHKIVDFEISDNFLVFKLDNGEIYWSGNRAAFKPEKLVLPSKSPITIGAAGVGTGVTIDDKLYTRFNLFGKLSEAAKIQEDVDTGIKSATIGDIFKGGNNILSLGGTYKLSYAIVN